MNPYTRKDIYIEPTLYDFFDSLRYEYEELYKNNNSFHPDKNVKVSTLYKYMHTQHNISFYDFNNEESE